MPADEDGLGRRGSRWLGGRDGLGALGRGRGDRDVEDGQRMWTLSTVRWQWMWMRGWDSLVAVDVTTWAEDSYGLVMKDNDLGRGWLGGQRRTLTWTAWSFVQKMWTAWLHGRGMTK
ncbi:hypothetical protein THAOC_19971 [Thalassiosira oceanica]|uniref:Uncharacterized protein n=1 Tax=Thalassiosira oceanica TaxID=159749 RepID=K0S164_THAOC|nr:hypothetical protein THAOC_19971 [Thalassiosira oceanica]|eukprot:EJK59768.1 hypothetical protein THAOC_19971 [Thalassiosira oceanica]